MVENPGAWVPVANAQARPMGHGLAIQLMVVDQSARSAHGEPFAHLELRRTGRGSARGERTARGSARGDRHNARGERGARGNPGAGSAPATRPPPCVWHAPPL